MAVDAILNRLSKVKQVAPNKWQARCPAHEDRSPSLAIKDDDGKVLLHCFAGCSVPDICGAIGVDVGELFPPRPLEYSWDKADKPAEFEKCPFTALDALRCLHMEGLVIAVAAADMAEGKVLSKAEDDRLGMAVGRIATALEYIDANT